ncbi:MAG TPA: hypothetical protein VJ739_13410, partial [Gemmataceae bacterium]|nr:hypothetical protein [Gemmataceae bacterium]
DLVETIMNVEEKFDLTLLDEEAEKLRTMGQLYDFVLDRVTRGQPQVCITSAAFYRLRRALMEVCGIPRERIQTQTRLEDLIPPHDRPRHWQGLKARLGNLHLPPLRRPESMVKWIETVSYLPLAPALVFSILLVFALGSTPAAFIAGLTVLVCGSVGMFLVRRAGYRHTERYAVHIPPACTTIRDMVYTLVSRHPAAPMVSNTARASDKEIWGTLCAIIGADFNRQPSSLTRDSTFT